MHEVLSKGADFIYLFIIYIYIYIYCDITDLVVDSTRRRFFFPVLQSWCFLTVWHENKKRMNDDEEEEDGQKKKKGKRKRITYWFGGEKGYKL